MPDASTQMRHLPFIEGMANGEDSDPSVHAVCAGLLVLRLVDAGMENPGLVALADGRAERSARSAVERISTGSSLRTILSTVLDALMDAPSDVRAVSERLMAYGQALNLDAQWHLAVDVYDTILHFVVADQHCETAVNALLRRAACLRELGRFSDASASCDMAIGFATRYGDKRGELRAQIGHAKLAYYRGNLPLADAMLVDTVRSADVHALSDIRSRVQQERAQVAFARGEYEPALRFGYAALRDCATEPERDRILNDIAGAFYMLGVRTAVRDVYLILATTACEQVQRWVATINLMALAADDGSRLHFEEFRTQLAGTPLPPQLLAEFEVHVGRGYKLFGEPALAREWLDRALVTAVTHSLNQLVFQIEEAMGDTANVQGTRTMGVSTPASIPEAVEHIAEQLRSLRERAVLVTE